MPKPAPTALSPTVIAGVDDDSPVVNFGLPVDDDVNNADVDDDIPPPEGGGGLLGGATTIAGDDDDKLIDDDVGSRGLLLFESVLATELVLEFKLVVLLERPMTSKLPILE